MQNYRIYQSIQENVENGSFFFESRRYHVLKIIKILQGRLFFCILIGLIFISIVIMYIVKMSSYQDTPYIYTRDDVFYPGYSYVKSLDYKSFVDYTNPVLNYFLSRYVEGRENYYIDKKKDTFLHDFILNYSSRNEKYQYKKNLEKYNNTKYKVKDTLTKRRIIIQKIQLPKTLAENKNIAKIFAQIVDKIDSKSIKYNVQIEIEFNLSNLTQSRINQNTNSTFNFFVIKYTKTILE